MSLSIEIGRRLADIARDDWDVLVGSHQSPFLEWDWLAGLEETGCVSRQTGWAPHHVLVRSGGRLVAAAPMYLKSHSQGEFVFDHAWAHAYARHGQGYFPKLLCAVPYSPVTGPRLLARDAAGRFSLVEAIASTADAMGLSSAHVNFHADGEDAAFGPDWLPRADLQYHWHNDRGWRDFDDFLAAMDHKHRKNIRQERARVRRAGIAFRIVHGDQAGEADLDAIHGLYLQTFAEYGNHPAISRGFLGHLAATIPRSLVLVLADLDGETIAGALCLRGGDTLYGRYWGAFRQAPGLHFETCYYQGIEYCLREGLTSFEPGAQGVHKIARGFLPTRVRSRHRIADPAFAAALREWCGEESAEIERHAAMLMQRSPFRASP